MLFFKWAISGIFSLFSAFQYSWQFVDYIKFTNDWIRTTGRWCRRQPLYQLSHNHSPKKLLYAKRRPKNFYQHASALCVFVLLVALGDAGVDVGHPVVGSANRLIRVNASASGGRSSGKRRRRRRKYEKSKK